MSLRSIPIFRALALVLLTVTVAACDSKKTDNDNNRPDSGGNSTDNKAPPHTVAGQIVDTQGAPLPGAVVWIYASFGDTTNAPVKTTTNAQGRYQSIELNSVSPFEAQAYKEVVYHGRRYCVRLAGETGTEYDTFNTENGVTLNWRWVMTGPSNAPTDVWGGSLKLEFDNSAVPFGGDKPIDVELVPDGPLLDGSQGQTVTKRTTVFSSQNYQGMVRDVPVGRYRMRAYLVENGARTPLRLTTQDDARTLQQEITMMFDGFTECGHKGTFPVTTIGIAGPQ